MEELSRRKAHPLPSREVRRKRHQPWHLVIGCMLGVGLSQLQLVIPWLMRGRSILGSICMRHDAKKGDNVIRSRRKGHVADTGLSNTSSTSPYRHGKGLEERSSEDPSNFTSNWIASAVFCEASDDGDDLLEDNVSALLSEMDLNGDGVVSEEEARLWIENHYPGEDAEEVRSERRSLEIQYSISRLARLLALYNNRVQNGMMTLWG